MFGKQLPALLPLNVGPHVACVSDTFAVVIFAPASFNATANHNRSIAIDGNARVFGRQTKSWIRLTGYEKANKSLLAPDVPAIRENELIGDEAFGLRDIPLQVRLTLFSLRFKNFLRRRVLRSCLTTHRLAESEPWYGNYCQSDQESTFCD